MGITSTFCIEEFRLLNGPLIDIRSPSEFIQGHWPGAINLPLFDNSERAEIGTIYAKRGRKKAVLQGLKLIEPRLSSLVMSLKNLRPNDDNKKSTKTFLRLYCWRGGMRSASVAWLANLFELNPVLLSGGYKTYRRWVLQQFEKKWPLHIIGGKTGSGKTDLLLAMVRKDISVIDLEGLANHRGSSFGGLGLDSQPTTEHYENLIAEELEFFAQKGATKIWLEDESANLGRCRIQHKFYNQMKAAPLLEIIRSKEERIAQLVNIYGKQEKGDLIEAALRISKRLGPQRTKEAIKAIEEGKWALASEKMLDYYDRCYEHELKKTPNRESINISGLSADMAVNKLIQKGLMS